MGLYGAPMGRPSAGGNGLPLLDADPDRYTDLRHPGDPACFDIFSAAACSVRTAADGELDPLGGLLVERVVAIGGSQSAMRLCAYANGIHDLHRVVDGYVLSVWEGRAPRLDDGPIPMYRRTTVRDDLDVPVMIVNSEFEATATHGLSLDDHHRRRVWEVTGAGHGQSRQARYDRDRTWSPSPVSWSPVHDAARRAMHRWLTDDTTPTAQPRIAISDGRPPSILRDDYGNAVGGIRLPELSVPIAEHRGRKMRTGRPALFGGARMFSDDDLRDVYPPVESYRRRWAEAVAALVVDGVILPKDSAALIARGEELAAPLPVA